MKLRRKQRSCQLTKQNRRNKQYHRRVCRLSYLWGRLPPVEVHVGILYGVALPRTWGETLPITTSMEEEANSK